MAEPRGSWESRERGVGRDPVNPPPLGSGEDSGPQAPAGLHRGQCYTAPSPMGSFNVSAVEDGEINPPPADEKQVERKLGQ